MLVDIQAGKITLGPLQLNYSFDSRTQIAKSHKGSTNNNEDLRRTSIEVFFEHAGHFQFDCIEKFSEVI